MRKFARNGEQQNVSVAIGEDVVRNKIAAEHLKEYKSDLRKSNVIGVLLLSLSMLMFVFGSVLRIKSERESGKEKVEQAHPANPLPSGTPAADAPGPA